MVFGWCLVFAGWDYITISIQIPFISLYFHYISHIYYFPYMFHYFLFISIYIYIPLIPTISHIFPKKPYDIPLFPYVLLRQQLAWMEVLRGRGYRGLPPLQKCAAAVATAVFRVKTEFFILDISMDF